MVQTNKLENCSLWNPKLKKSRFTFYLKRKIKKLQDKKLSVHQNEKLTWLGRCPVDFHVERSTPFERQFHYESLECFKCFWQAISLWISLLIVCRNVLNVLNSFERQFHLNHCLWECLPWMFQYSRGPQRKLQRLY